MENLQKTKDLRAWRLSLLCSVAGLTMTAGATPAFAQSAASPPPGNDAAPMQLPTITVEGAAPGTQYNPSQPSLPKLTEPLLDTPQSITAVPRQLMEDQGVVTLRDALRNVPGLSIA